VTDADPHAPTNAGPAPEPTPVVGASQATWSQPAGSAAAGSSGQVDEHPEKLVGAAFGGGLGVALFLKTLAKRRHR
jgi:hypothetical protein